MIAPIDQLTTLASNRPFLPVRRNNSLTSDLLYFHIILTANNKDFSNDQRTRLERRLLTYLKAFNGQAETIAVSNGQVHFLVGLEINCFLTEFVNRLKIVSKSYVRRRLFIERFEWQEEFEVSTVSLSQVKYVSRNLRRQKRFAIEEFNSPWQRISIKRAC